MTSVPTRSSEWTRSVIFAARIALALHLTIIPVAQAEPVGMQPRWSNYENGVREYAVDVPPGFIRSFTPENGNGGRWRGAPGHAVLSIWGAYLIDSTFSANTGSRIAADTADGWSLDYRATSGQGASWSGVRGSRIRYTRGVVRCGDRTINFSIEYDVEAKAAFDPIVSRLVRSMRGTGPC